MGKSKKKFIDKKNAITFTLVHRSQKDPLLVDESAPQHVLKPVNSGNAIKDKKKQREEQIKYGIYFDDEYNYLQHLRDPQDNSVEMERVFIPARTRNKGAGNLMNELNSPLPSSASPARLQLPSSVFASQYEEQVGLLNKAAPRSGLRLDLDPDIVAAMDEDFDYDNPDNMLEDDFVLRAKGNDGDFEEAEGDDFYAGSVDAENSDYEDMSSELSGENDDQFDENDPRLKMFDKEETKSRFTEYSMSSSVMRRNENLTNLDDHFETMFAKYDDTELGALECEDIEGDIMTNDERLLSIAEEFEKERQAEKFNQEKNAAILARIAEGSESEDNSSGDEYERMVIREKEKWDCESILSTYSNIYNHPTLITEAKTSKIRINPKTGLPITPATSKLTPSLLATLDNRTEAPGGKKGPGSVISAISTLSIRDKHESPEEKRERKNALKEYRKERRMEKKANKLAFKDEKKRVERQFIHTKIQKQGIHL